MTGVGGTSTTVVIGKKNQTPVSADLIIAKSEKDGTFTITAKNLQGFDGYKEVKIPFWSHANGMKDIVWYTPTRQADGSYTVTAKANDHENADGKYEAQVFYVDAQGQNKFVKKAFIDYTATKPANAVAADLTITKSEKDGTFTITAKNLQGFDGYKEVKIPFWSHANGMKDIIWYTPNRQADGSYTVTAKASDHENADGKYEAQVFYVDAQGQNKFVKKAFIDYTASKVAADLTITKSEKDGTFTITAKNLQGFDGYKEVKIPFWSHANGMKDIIWYTPTRQADGSYTVTAKASDHENADGQYEAQVFYVDAQGQNKFVKKAFIDYKNQSRSTGTLLIQNNNKDTGTFDVIIKDVYSLKVCGPFKFQLGRIRTVKTISAGMKRLVKRTEIIRYPSKRAITRTQLENTMFTFITSKMMVLGLVLVQQPQMWNLEMPRPRPKRLSRMSMQQMVLIRLR